MIIWRLTLSTYKLHVLKGLDFSVIDIKQGKRFRKQAALRS